MGIMSSEWRGRLQHWMRTLKDDFYRPLGEISWEAFRTMEHLSQEEAMNGPFEPVEPGFTWGKTWEYCWFRGKVVLPAEAQGKRIVMDLKPDGESTLFVNGQEFGTYRASWVTQKHHFVEDNVLTTDAVAGTEYEILMETYAGHYYPESPDGGCATGPVLPGAYQDPLEEGKRRTLGVCTFGIWNEDAYQLWMDADTLRQLLDKLDPNSLRAAKIAEALEAFTLVVDFENRILQGRQRSTPPCTGSEERFHYACILRNRQCPYRSGMAVADGRDTQKDRAYLCSTAAPAGRISGIQIYPEPACRL